MYENILTELRQVTDQFIKSWNRGISLRNDSKHTSIPLAPIPVIILSNRLKVTAGRCICKKQTLFGREIWSSEIHLSTRYLEKFGYQRIEQTLRHELAHHVIWWSFRIKGHGDLFKSVCAAFGGSMNRQLAGEDYANCATDEYFRSR
jgi:hypothetical protein